MALLQLLPDSVSSPRTVTYGLQCTVDHNTQHTHGTDPFRRYRRCGAIFPGLPHWQAFLSRHGLLQSCCRLLYFRTSSPRSPSGCHQRASSAPSIWTSFPTGPCRPQMQSWFLGFQGSTKLTNHARYTPWSVETMNRTESTECLQPSLLSDDKQSHNVSYWSASFPLLASAILVAFSIQVLFRPKSGAHGPPPHHHHHTCSTSVLGTYH
jgi:hypothetical protein